MFDVNDRGWRIELLLAVSVMFLTLSNGCAAAESAEKEEKETVVISLIHGHSAEILEVRVLGKVPVNGKKIGVTAKFSESEPVIDRLTILDPEGRTIVVPRSYFEKVRLPQENSLSLGYIMSEDSNTVAGIRVFLDFGELRRRADLKCANDRGDPVFETFTLFYEIKSRKFETTFLDHCGEPMP